MKAKKPITRSTQGYPVYRPTVSKILICQCSVRYIKTRAHQTMCIKCTIKENDLKLHR